MCLELYTGWKWRGDIRACFFKPWIEFQNPLHLWLLLSSESFARYSGTHGDPISVCILGWGHLCPPVERGAGSKAVVLTLPVDTGRQRVAVHYLRSLQEATTHLSVPPEGTVPLGQREDGIPTGAPCATKVASWAVTTAAWAVQKEKKKTMFRDNL